MVKIVIVKVGSLLRTALVVVGWIMFVLGFVVRQPVLLVPILAVARVLPQTPLGKAPRSSLDRGNRGLGHSLTN